MIVQSLKTNKSKAPESKLNLYMHTENNQSKMQRMQMYVNPGPQSGHSHPGNIGVTS